MVFAPADRAGNEYFPYLHTRLTLMVPPGNPGRLKTLIDLGREEVRHWKNAEKFPLFIKSGPAGQIYAQHGFTPGSGVHQQHRRASHGSDIANA